MNQFTKEGLARNIAESLNLSEEDKVKVVAEIENEFGQMCHSSWAVEDIHCCIRNKDMDVEVSDEEAAEILGWIEMKHDASIGINWDVIEYYIEEFVKERDK